MADDKPNQKDPSDAMRAMRSKLLTGSPSEFGVDPSKEHPNVYGVIMEFPIDDITASVVALSDGTASLYTTSTFGIIGGSGHASVRRAAESLVTQGEKFISKGVAVKAFPYPSQTEVYFYLLTFNGVKLLKTSLSAIESGQDMLSKFFEDGQAVLTELRTVTEVADGRPNKN